MSLFNGYKKYGFTRVCTGKFVPQIKKKPSDCHNIIKPNLTSINHC